MEPDIKMVMARAQRMRGGSPSQQEYEMILDEIATVRLSKVLSYGEGRYTDELPPDVNLMMVMSDIYRKFIRLRTQIVRMVRGDGSAQDGEALRDTFIDSANYNLMGAQLLARIPGVQQVIHRPMGGIGAYGMVDQVAIATKTPEAFITALEIFGIPASSWIEDTVTANGHVLMPDGTIAMSTTNKARLYFNYNLGPFEFELLHYTDGLNWLHGREGLSHIGIHVPNANLAMLGFKDLLGERSVAQQVTTIAHTNPAVNAAKRRYEYVILNTRSMIGFDLKLIGRLSAP